MHTVIIQLLIAYRTRGTRFFLKSDGHSPKLPPAGFLILTVMAASNGYIHKKFQIKISTNAFNTLNVINSIILCFNIEMMLQQIILQDTILLKILVLTKENTERNLLKIKEAFIYFISLTIYVLHRIFFFCKNIEKMPNYRKN